MLKGYKTIIFNAVMTAVMFKRVWGVEVEVTEDMIASGLDALDAGLVALWGIGNAILRSVTNSSIFNKDK